MANRCLINDKVNNSLNNIVHQCFLLNRVLDRQMSQLSVKFTMNKTSNKLHPLLAHAPLKLADFIGDYQDQRNALTVYGEVPLDTTDYLSVLEIFENFLESMREFEDVVQEAVNVCDEEADLTTKVFLQDFLMKIIPFSAQAVLLCDKIEAYGDIPMGRMLFDSNIEDFIIVPMLIGKG